MPVVCAIHQPNFFPWLGYFDKIKRADVFVFLDDVQNPKTGSSWVNRARLNAFGKEKWYTCPIARPSGVIAINQVEFADKEWRENFLEVLKNYYRKYPNVKNGLNLVEKLIYKENYHYIADMNQDIVMYLANHFGYKTQFFAKSGLNIRSQSTNMLIDVCKAVGADTYMCGGGASGYQDDKLFKESDINIMYQNYIPEFYRGKEFLPGLSVIDYIMNMI